MRISNNSTDSIDKWIRDDSLRITAVEFSEDLSKMTIYVNGRSVMEFPVQEFPRLIAATPTELKNYTLIAEGMGVHWPVLDEDLSLKGFLLADMKRRIRT